MKNAVQLITYADRFGCGDLRDLRNLLAIHFAGLFGGVHLLPFFHAIDGADAGFDPIDHTLVDPRLGDWTDVRSLAQDTEVMADLIVNHVSVESRQFKDYSRLGGTSAYSGLFLTLDYVFPKGISEADLRRIHRSRPGPPFTVTTLANGEERKLWTTFTPSQLDIDVLHPQGVSYLRSILAQFQSAGVKSVRLDAAGYAIKKPGTSCFMLPETYDFISGLAGEARSRGMEVLVEIHCHYAQQIEIARRVDRVYDFALPPLILHALFQGDASYLKNWLMVSPRNAVTVLDTHDGIGVRDVGADQDDPVARPGLLPPAAIDDLVEKIHSNSNGESRQATGGAASNVDVYQVNCTYYDALGRDDRSYLIARAIQFFAPGIPQVYYAGLLAGHNDMALLARTKVGRDINRHYYNPKEITAALARPVVQALIRLIRFRNEHPAFAGQFELGFCTRHELRLVWLYHAHRAVLEVNLVARTAKITHTTAADGESSFMVGLDNASDPIIS